VAAGPAAHHSHGRGVGGEPDHWGRWIIRSRAILVGDADAPRCAGRAGRGNGMDCGSGASAARELPTMWTARAATPNGLGTEIMFGLAGGGFGVRDRAVRRFEARMERRDATGAGRRLLRRGDVRITW